jgi:hypothetical protein
MNAKDQMIVEAVRHDTYRQAQQANWPRNTCVDCHVPCGYDREFIATGRCQKCYDESPLIVQKKAASDDQKNAA